MGKHQRRRERVLPPLIEEYARHLKAVIEDETGEVPTTTWQQVTGAQLAADIRAIGMAVPPPPPTPEEMMARSIEDLSRLEFGLTQQAWRLRDGKEGRVVSIKFDTSGDAIYRLQLADGRTERHHAAKIGQRWSKQRVYFPVDLETGRPILPGVNSTA